MKNLKYLSKISLSGFPLWWLGGLLCLFSCNTLIDLEDKPSTGSVTLVTDWTNRTEGVDIPASYNVEINNQTLTFNDISNTLPELEAGTYPTLIYHTADKITLNGSVVTVKTENGIVDPTPGWLFTYTGDITSEVGKDKTVTATMVQQVRQLIIELTVKGGSLTRIAATEAVLSGVANALDIQTNTHLGDNISVVPVFAQNDDKLTAHIRLIGVTGTQKLTITLKFTDGGEQTIETELTDKFTDFNVNKHKVFTLTADLNTPAGAGFEASITGWKIVEGHGGMAW